MAGSRIPIISTHQPRVSLECVGGFRKITQERFRELSRESIVHLNPLIRRKGPLHPNVTRGKLVDKGSST